MKKLALAAVAASMLAAPAAFAQTASSTTALNETQVSKLWRASKLDGVNIYNNNNEKIGEIDDVLVDRSGKAMAVVVDVGGFLGIGTHRVALKFDDVKFSDMPRNTNMANANSDRAATTTTTTTTTAPAGAPPATVSTTDNNARANAANNAANRMYPDHAMLNMTKDQLKALPQVSYSR